MDKNAIKKYAVWARRELISRVSQKALQYGITADEAGNAEADSVNGKLLTEAEKRQRAALIKHIKENGFEQVMEEVAYTWFNRFCALRFMEVNGYLPTHVRVFSNEVNEFKPQILTEAINVSLEGLDVERVYRLKHDNKTEELFKYLIITQCNALNSVLPGMFQKIADYTELLFPDNLLREGSVVEQLVSQIPADDFDVQSDSGQIEIIGWLYQYYISEKHEEVIDPLHGKVVKKEEVPAATQLFTTDWVVRYLIDNSVGRYWIERHPESKLKDGLQYFVMPKSGEMKYIDESIEPKDLTILDPCIGSGHFLIYAFDVLIKIYTEYGYSSRDAAAMIVEDNLYGLDIDDRAAQLAYFAVMMKARQYDRRFLERGIKPQIYSIQESNHLSTETFNYIVGGNSYLRQELSKVVDVFYDAKEYGSILQMPDIDIQVLYSRFDEIIDDISLFQKDAIENFLPLCRIAEVLSQKYAVVATNPPYLNKYDTKLKGFLETHYKDYSGDLFSVFMYRNLALCNKEGYAAFMTPNVWMFIKTYEKLRHFILNNKNITTLVQMAKGAFFKEATVDICAFVLDNQHSAEKGLYIRLEEFKGDMEVQKEKALAAIEDEVCDYLYEATESNFSKIPGSPIAYWASKNILKTFEFSETIGLKYKTITGSSTGENARFLRLWFEVSNQKIGFRLTGDYNGIDYKWIPCNKGGEFRRWYGNAEYIINWENDGTELKAFATYKNNGKHWSRFLKSLDCFYKEGITWSKVTSGSFCVRYMPEGFIMESAACAIMPRHDDIGFLLALMNSKIVTSILRIKNPTINMQTGDIIAVPIISDTSHLLEINDLSLSCTKLSQTDWDSFETSWDFKRHPLI